MPIGRAHLAVLVGELEGLDETDSLIDRTTNREVIDRDLTEDALRVNDEKTTESDALVLDKDTVLARNP
jgi:hypothetical protein